MKNFILGVSREDIQSHGYRISRSSAAYSFLDCEYHALPRDLEGNIIVAGDDALEGENKRVGVFCFIWNRVFRNDQSVVVKASAPEISFFKSEYSYRMPEDRDHNLIVPAEEYQRGKTR